MAITVNTTQGTSITVSVSGTTQTTFTTTTNSISVTSPTGSTISVLGKGVKGDAGDTGPAGEGFVSGGSENQFIQKNSSVDYDTKWSAYTLPAADGDDGQVLTTNGAATVTFAYPKTIAEDVKNVSGGPLVKGTPVHVTGSVGNLAEVIAADAATNYPAHFVLNEDLADDQEGLGIAIGFINNVDVPDASIYTEGQTVYLGESGGWTTTKPTGANAIQNLGIIIKVNVTGGGPAGKISGIIMGAGRANDVPNIATGNIWAGNVDGVATATSVAYIDIANSRVGIGTTAPAANLHVFSSGNGEIEVERSGGALINLQAQSAKGVIGTDTNHPLSLKTNSGERLTISTSGNVGIGTTSPSQKLEVSFAASTYGARFTRNDAAGSSLIEFANNAGVKNVTGYNAGVDGYTIGTSADTHLTVRSTGNVGIGTTAPSQKLEVDGFILLQNNDEIRFKDSVGTERTAIELDPNNDLNIGTSAGGNLKFINGSSYVERMRIDSSGNVGIGATSPTSKLQVSGITQTGTQIPFRIENDTSNTKFQINSASGDYMLQFKNAGNVIRNQLHSNGDSYLNGGNVGIGTASPQAKLHLNSGADDGLLLENGNAILGNTGSGYTELLYWSNGNAYYGRQTNNVPGGVGGSVDSHSFRTGGQSRLIIDSSGNVGIGTTSPSQKLTIDQGVGNVNQGIPATTGSSQNGILRLQPGGPYGESFDFGMNVSTTYAWIQPTNKANHSVNYNLSLNPNGGNVGIGTTTPTEKLTVSGNISVSGDVYSDQIKSLTYPNYNILNLEDDNVINSNGVSLLSVSSMVFGLDTNDNSSNDQFRWIADGATANTGSVLMALTDKGELGIGTISPSAKLDVVGLANIKDGSNNVMISSANTAMTGASNTTVGYQAGRSNTSGGSNSFVGLNAGYSNTIGHSNSFVGRNAGYSNTSGGSNSFVGYQAGNNNDTGSSNTSVGYAASYSNTTGFSNTAVGRSALYNSTGSLNVAIGREAAYGGVGASFSNTTAVGYQALYGLTTGVNNVAVGYQAARAVSTANNNTAIGYVALDNTNTSYNTAVGAYCLKDNTLGERNTAVGWYAAHDSTGSYNSSFGMRAGRYAGDGNTAIGYDAATNTTGNNNVIVGKDAGFGVPSTSTYSYTVAVGYQALQDLTSGAGNTAVGYQASTNTNTGYNNTTVGYQAGLDNTTGYNNCFFGHQAGTNSTSGNDNTSVGYKSGFYTTEGVGNSFFGTNSGYNNTTADNNTFIGGSAGYSNTTGENNTILGRSAGFSNTTGSRNIFIGYQAGYNETGSNKLYIANSDTTTPLIYGEFDNEILNVNGKLKPNSITVDDEGLSAAGDYGPGAEIWYQGTSTPSAGFCYYLDSTGGWTAAQANASGTATGMLAVSAGTDSDVDGMVLRGFVQISNTLTGSVGDAVYLETSAAGRFTTTKPTGAGNFVRRVGYLAKGTNVIYFNPSPEWEAL